MSARLILVTGARGFVGRRLCRRLLDAGYRVRGSVRRGPAESEAGIDYRVSGDIGDMPDWRPLLDGVEAVVHLAARVHLQDGGSGDSGAAYGRVNAAASDRLARQAAEAGVKRLVFLSSIKAKEAAHDSNGAAARQDPYGASKLEAERALSIAARDTGLEVAVLRPPLVYGPGAGANFALLARAVARGIPLPLAGIRNRRSFIHIDNLCGAIALCLDHPQAPGGVFELSDGPPVSTPDFVRALGRGLGKPARLFPCPPRLLLALGAMLGRRQAMESLTGDLVADGRAIGARLGWEAPLNLEAAMKATFAAPEQGAG